MKLNYIAWVVGALTVWTGQAADAPFTIENDSLKVMVAPATGAFELREKVSGRVVLRDGLWVSGQGKVQVTAVKDPTFGAGSAIESDAGKIMVFPKLPFALFRGVLRNPDAALRVTNAIPLLSFNVVKSAPDAPQITLGTGGLLAPEKNPGSYAWMAVANPKSREGLVTGWLTHDRASGVILASATNDALRLEARGEYGRLQIKPGQSAETETFAVGWFTETTLGLEAWADAVARVYRIQLPPQPSGYCTWYSSPHGGASDAPHLAELSAFAATNLAPFGFSVVQIDDKWQAGISSNGPRRNFTISDPKGPYPDGMKASADQIKSLGLVPGIWFMPFAGTYYDPFFKEHQDWFVKDAQGRPFETRWGGTCMDMTHPGAREHLRGLVQRIAHEWGYQYFKMDGLWTGTGSRLMYVNDLYKDDHFGEGILSNPDKTHIEAFRDGLRLVRETAGPKIFILGCCAPQNMRSYAGAFGLVDAMRVGPDNGSNWKGLLRGPIYGSRQYFLHGRIWYNDPDPVYIRPSVPLAQAQLICSWVALSGQLNLSSEWLPAMPAERLDLLHRTMPPHGRPARPLDLLENDPPRIWLLRDDTANPPRLILGLFNWDADQPLHLEIPLERLGLRGETIAGFDFWANRFVAPATGRLLCDVPPASCRILALRPLTGRPQLLSTARHITQGIVDVAEETWQTDTLAGRSRVVAGDPGELRVLVPVGDRSWQAVSAEAGPARQPLPVRQRGPEVRVTLPAGPAGELAWRIQFRPGPVQTPPPTLPTGLKATVGFQSVHLIWDKDDNLDYQIQRTPGATSQVASAEFTDASPQPGAAYEYRVLGRNAAGQPSAPAVVRVEIPQRPTLPPVPPLPAVPLAKLKPLSATTGWGKVTPNRSCAGKPLTIGGKTYAEGIGVHAQSTLVYAIPAGMKHFVAVAGLDDDKKTDPRPSVRFKIYGDVKEMGEPPVLLAESPLLKWDAEHYWHFNVELSDRHKEIRLLVEDGGDGIAADHADWANAGFGK
ncbi:MAG: NPCBM/NEW2 domain-containing protein [Verrucomicrobiota bacterium]